MRLQAFQQAFLVALAEALPKGLEITSREFTRNNGAVRLGVRRKEEGRISPVIYPESYYHAYQAGVPMRRLARDAAAVLTAEPPDIGVSFDDLASVRDRIVFRLVGREKNGEFLKTAVHRDFLDLALSYGVLLTEQPDGVNGMTPVLSEMAEEWGADEADLFRAALQNTPRLLGDKLNGMRELLPVSEDLPDSGPELLYVLTNRECFYGASVLVYSGKVRELADRLGTDLYILPSSIHEVILTPYDPERRDGLAEIVQKTNALDVCEEDVLSDSVYLYERKKDQIKLA